MDAATKVYHIIRHPTLTCPSPPPQAKNHFLGGRRVRDTGRLPPEQSLSLCRVRGHVTFHESYSPHP